MRAAANDTAHFLAVTEREREREIGKLKIKND